MKTREERLKKLEEKQNQLKAKIQKIKAMDSAEERKRDTRKKVVVGAVMLEMVQSGEWPEEKFKGMLDRKLTRARDRELFGLSIEGAES